jgi:ABC-type nitrate/sulfonate/bicarbonate transport system substrate-binding protein
MSKFIIAPHMRLHEWVAVEKGYFDAENLDYELHDELYGADGTRHHLGDKVGAYQTFEKGRSSDVSCACHWTVNVAAASGHGMLYADCYSMSPCAIFVPADSEIKTPEDLADVPISVGYQSGSHYSTIQALEEFLKPEQIKLSFADGLLFSRLELLIDGKVPAASLFSGPYYFLEQLGFRKVADTSFMMASMVAEDANRDDVEKYFRALKRAQADIDLRPELYTHYYREEFPERFRDQMDTRRFGPGERIVFEPYSREIFESSRRWIAERNIFEDGNLGQRDYADSIVVSAAE